MNPLPLNHEPAVEYTFSANGHIRISGPRHDSHILEPLFDSSVHAPPQQRPSVNLIQREFAQKGVTCE